MQFKARNQRFLCHHSVATQSACSKSAGESSGLGAGFRSNFFLVSTSWYGCGAQQFIACQLSVFLRFRDTLYALNSGLGSQKSSVEKGGALEAFVAFLDWS